MLRQRGSERDHEFLAGLASCQADLIAGQIDLRPGQGGDVSEALTCVEPELDQAFPFVVCHIEHGVQLIDGERTTV